MMLNSKPKYFKRTLSVLLEIYLREEGIRHCRLGGFTLPKEGEMSGKPVETYCIGNHKEIPDIVLETMIPGESINSLDIYKSKRVPEVWFWNLAQLRVFYLNGDDYQEMTRSELVSELDLNMLLHYSQYYDQHEAVQGFLEIFRGPFKKVDSL